MNLLPQDLEFQFPEAFWLFLLLPPLAVYLWKQRKTRKASIRVSYASPLFKVRGWRSYLAEHLPFLRILVLALLIVALSRPRQRDTSVRSKNSQGIDIVLAFDVSASMLAKDLSPNRFDAMREVAKRFIQSRVGDRIALVVFAGESYTLSPLTTDQNILLNALKDLKYGQIEDGTAIGMGLATSVNRLRKGTGEGRVIILLTDGVNNSGQIDPTTAADLALTYGLRVYTIGVGTNGTAPTPVGYDFSGQLVFRNLPVEIDEDLMKRIAESTGGKYFRATDNQSLENIYTEIDRLERKEVQELRFYAFKEHFRPFVFLALVLFSLEWLIRLTLIRGLT